MWDAQYQQQPFERTELAKLAEEYHQRTEEYDRRVCTGPIVNGAIMPASSMQRRFITAHALEVRAEIMALAIKLGYAKEDVQKAIFNHARRT